MHKGKRLLNLVRGVAFLVFVCAGSFLLQTEGKRILSLSKEKNMKDALRNKQLKV